MHSHECSQAGASSWSELLSREALLLRVLLFESKNQPLGLPGEKVILLALAYPTANSDLLVLQRFFRTFLEGRDDKEVRVSDWRQHPIVGRLREVSFVSAVKRTMGISPPFAHCHQTQRYRQATTDTLLIEESIP